MTEKLRVAVIGAGRWSTTAHLPGFTRSPLSQVVVLCDLDRELAEKKAKMFNVTEIETDYEKVLSRRDIDVVDIVTRDDHGDNHEILTFAALQEGKHVLVEKPVAHNYKRVQEAHRLALSKGV